MASIETIKKGLECCLGGNDCDIERNENCPYKDLPLCSMFLREDVNTVFKLLEEQQPKTGRWINKDESGFENCYAECSCCGKVSSGFLVDNGFGFDAEYHDYCPKCGAKMENDTE